MSDSWLRSVETLRAVSATDMVFDDIYSRVVTLDLAPGERISEAEIARQTGVSRQPVRDAFYRLSQLGFLAIRPQRPTLISKISEASVLQARFIRTAIELETVRKACDLLSEDDLDELQMLIEQQEQVVARDARVEFHELDDTFHRRICEMAGHGYAWALIRDTKAHMDRVRFLSLSSGAIAALEDHKILLDALRNRDADAATDRLRIHLTRILEIIELIRTEHAEYFDDDQS